MQTPGPGGESEGMRKRGLRGVPEVWELSIGGEDEEIGIEKLGRGVGDI